MNYYQLWEMYYVTTKCSKRQRERERERESELTKTTPKQSYCKIEKSWLLSCEFDVWTRPKRKKNEENQPPFFVSKTQNDWNF